MPTWTLRLITCAGVVALLGRLPAIDSVSEAFVIGLVGWALILAAHYGSLLLRTGLTRLRATFTPQPGDHPLHLGSFHPTHGADA